MTPWRAGRRAGAPFTRCASDRRDVGRRSRIIRYGWTTFRVKTICSRRRSKWRLWRRVAVQSVRPPIARGGVLHCAACGAPAKLKQGDGSARSRRDGGRNVRFLRHDTTWCRLRSSSSFRQHARRRTAATTSSVAARDQRDGLARAEDGRAPGDRPRARRSPAHPARSPATLRPTTTRNVCGGRHSRQSITTGSACLDAGMVHFALPSVRDLTTSSSRTSATSSVPRSTIWDRQQTSCCWQSPRVKTSP